MAAAAGAAVLVAAILGVALVATAATPRIDLTSLESGRGSTAVPSDIRGAIAASSSGDLGTALVVDVAGGVRRAGLYHLPAGSRVGDAIEAAGGFGASVDAIAVARDLNLAAPLSDGQKVVVPTRGSDVASAPQASAGNARGLVDLNRASQSELEALPGIGPVTARKIIDSRTERPFAAPQDLLDRKLVGASTWEKLRDLVTAS
jgi:competence protein ComEA